MRIDRVRVNATPMQMHGMKRGARIILARFVPLEDLNRPLCLWILQDPDAADTAQAIVIVTADQPIFYDVAEHYMLTFDIGDTPYFLFAKEGAQ